jgi:hypothetical protein
MEVEVTRRCIIERAAEEGNVLMLVEKVRWSRKKGPGLVIIRKRLIMH